MNPKNVFLLGALFVFAMVSLCFAVNSPLSFEQRLIYQKAIEEVYWSNTIWPAVNQKPKPPLEQILSEKDIQLKVSKYFLKSETLGPFIAPKELQSEMDRMARESKDPDLLRKIWSALNNDPYLIAECFVRPILTERFRNVMDQRTAEETNVYEQEWDFSSFAYRLPRIKGNYSSSKAMRSTLRARWGHTTIWTGTHMIVWGGVEQTTLNSGDSYDPATNSWFPISVTDAPAGRAFHTAIWTGTEMIIWGGTNFETPLQKGKRYNPFKNTWLSMSNETAPAARYRHTAVWSGTEMIIWGGTTNGVSEFVNRGGRYDPVTNSWTPTTTFGAPSARAGHTAVWTGNQMIIWGGCFGSTDCTQTLKTGSSYDPLTDTWSPIATNGAPEARVYHTAIFTDTEMIVWGGTNWEVGTFNTGGRYNLATDSWTPTTTTLAPSQRYLHSAIWTGSEMIVWGGGYDLDELNTGGRYSPALDSWNGVSTGKAPPARVGHSAIWTGTEMIMWGGVADDNPLNTGGRYNPLSNSWSPTSQ